jgi:hypothetical protein
MIRMSAQERAERRASRQELQAANRAVSQAAMAGMTARERNAWRKAQTFRMVFQVLRVTVKDSDVNAYPFGKRRLGSLTGATAEVTDGARMARVGAAAGATAVLGPGGMLAALSTKSWAHAFVVFADGTYHERKLDGNATVRRAQAECVRFNLLAEAAQPGRLISA